MTVQDSSECPADFPFVIDDGNHCCKYYTRNNNASNPICDGTDIQASDPVECCDGVADCTDLVHLCRDRNTKESKFEQLMLSSHPTNVTLFADFCPNKPSKTRHEHYWFEYHDVELTFFEARDYCANISNGRLAKIISPEMFNEVFAASEFSPQVVFPGPSSI